MGEFGDALSTAITSQTDLRPSLFEVLAQDNLTSAIRPAIAHAFRVLSETHPSNFRWLHHYFHEVYTIVECVIQHHFLSNFSASFAEYYYDMRREPMQSVSNSSKHFPLGKRLHFLSITTLSVFPYLKIKLNEQYDLIREKYILKGYKELSLIERTLFFCYPYLCCMWNLSILYHNFSYAVGKSHFHSTFHQIMKIKLLYSTESSAEKDSSQFSGLFTKLLTSSVSAGVFMVQFMEWWFEGDNPVKKVMKGSTPQAPTHSEKRNIPVPANEICPLCNQLKQRAKKAA